MDQAPFAALPADVLRLVVEALSDARDAVRLGAACRELRAVVAQVMVPIVLPDGPLKTTLRLLADSPPHSSTPGNIACVAAAPEAGTLCMVCAKRCRRLIPISLDMGFILHKCRYDQEQPLSIIRPVNAGPTMVYMGRPGADMIEDPHEWWLIPR